jgi:hypothetical protein
MNGSLQLFELSALPILLTSVGIMSLCGCTSEETAGRFLAAPGKYVLYSCGEMANEARGIANRQQELAALMQKAGTDAGGRFVSAQAYQPEYIQLRSRMDELRKTAAEKNCNLSGGRQRSKRPASRTANFGYRKKLARYGWRIPQGPVACCANATMRGLPWPLHRGHCTSRSATCCEVQASQTNARRLHGSLRRFGPAIASLARGIVLASSGMSYRRPSERHRHHASLRNGCYL